MAHNKNSNCILKWHIENYQSQVKMAKNHILFDGLLGIMIMRLYNEL